MRIGRARQAEDRLRRINTYGVPSVAARGLQSAIVQGTLLYASELAWNGGKGAKGVYQRSINRIGGATLGAFRSTPLGIVAAESGHTPARALLNHCQASPAYRLHARPKDGEGLEETLERGRSALSTRLRAAASPRQGHGRDPGMGEPPALPGAGNRREQGGRPSNGWPLGAERYLMDKVEMRLCVTSH